MTDPNLNLNDPNNTTSGLGGALVADLDGFVINGTGVLTPQTDNSPASFTGNYAFGGQDFFGCSICEFDFVGQGSVTSGALTGTGLVSDPFAFFSANLTDSGVAFAGTATPDGSNAGRYTMIPLAITVTGSSASDLSVVIYQASGEQLYWMDEDGFSLFLGPIEPQTFGAKLPTGEKPGAKTEPTQKK